MNPTADQQLQSAAYGGDYTACKAAYAQGATNFNKMLYEAARGGHRDLCELAKSWGADNFNDIFIEDMREDIQQLIKYWQACKGDPTLPAWVSLFGLLAITDDYFHLTQASFEHVRWVKILSQLPLELQAMICFQCHGLAQEPVVTAQKIDTGGRWLFPAGDTPAIS